MADGGLTVVDGAQLRDHGLSLPVPDGAATGAVVLELVEKEVAARIPGFSFSENLKSAVLGRVSGGDDDGFLSMEFSGGDAVEKVRECLVAIADELKDDPLVILVLDGRALRVFLDDEDDFAMLAEDLFTDLDTDDNGKLSRNHLRNALVHMGAQMGVPPFSESNDLLNQILKKYGAEGEEQLGQAQFAQLLQLILQELADALSKNHISLIQNIKVINGSKLKKILEDEKLFGEVFEEVFQQLNANSNGEGSKEVLRGYLEGHGPALGLPPCKSNEAAILLYDQIFANVAEEKVSGKVEKGAFQVLLKDIIEKFAQQLEENPIFVDLEN